MVKRCMRFFCSCITAAIKTWHQALAVKFYLYSMQLPTDREIFEGEIATYWMDDGILVSLSKNPKRTIANITENIALVKRITGDKKVPLLIYLSNSPIPDKATREFSAEQLPNVYSAMAMVSKAALAKLIMNMLFNLKTPPIPMKNFTDDQAAKKWLKEFLEVAPSKYEI